MMAEVIDGELVDASQPPAARSQARPKVELLPAVQISVGQEADRVNCGAPIKPATVEPRDVARAPIRIVASGTLDVFEIVLFALDDDPADSCKRGVRFEALDRSGDEAPIQSLVAIHQADVIARAVLIAKLCADAAASIPGTRERYDPDGIPFCDFDGQIGRQAVGQNDFSPQAIECRHRALD